MFKLIIKDRGELNEKSFYNIMSKCAPYIAQRILERKVNNKDNLKQNKEIIDYFKKTEESFEKQNNNNNILNNSIKIKKKKKRIFEYFEKINEDEKITKLDNKELAELIQEVRKETENVIRDKSQPTKQKQIYKKKFNYAVTYGNFFGKKRGKKKSNKLNKSFDLLDNNTHNNNLRQININNLRQNRIWNPGLYNRNTSLILPLFKRVNLMSDRNNYNEQKDNTIQINNKRSWRIK